MSKGFFPYPAGPWRHGVAQQSVIARGVAQYIANTFQAQHLQLYKFHVTTWSPTPLTSWSTLLCFLYLRTSVVWLCLLPGYTH
jgi:hypothetical protein